MDQIHVNITITGHVQGVGFRYHALEAARSLGLVGYVKNRPNGEVYAEAEGTKDAVEQFIAWCKKGAPRARVHLVDVTESSIMGFGEFRIG